MLLYLPGGNECVRSIPPPTISTICKDSPTILTLNGFGAAGAALFLLELELRGDGVDCGCGVLLLLRV